MQDKKLKKKRKRGREGRKEGKRNLGRKETFRLPGFSRIPLSLDT
jgi:hypothetical protein